MDLNFPVFATGVRIFRANNDVGPLFVAFVWTQDPPDKEIERNLFHFFKYSDSILLPK
jgi:hypothetical protein